MNLSDLFIIYLACGAPFGVYYFLQNRKRSFSRQLWFKTILIFLFWIPYAFKLLRAGKFFRYSFTSEFDKKDFLDATAEKTLAETGQKIEKLILKSDPAISIYEIREIFDRYAGLTIAAGVSAFAEYGYEKEIFRIAGYENIKTGAACLHRRNQKRLVFHQTLAREDFLRLVGKLADSAALSEEAAKSVLEFVKIIGDSEAVPALEKMFFHALQTDKNLPVRDLEIDLWNSETHTQQPAAPLAMNLPALRAAATTNSSPKD